MPSNLMHAINYVDPINYASQPATNLKQDVILIMEPKSNIESLTNICQNDAPFADACMDGFPPNFDSDCVSS